MRVIVGLGNPGPEYGQTRHNLGWLALDYLARRWRISFEKRRLAFEASTNLHGTSVLLVRPIAWMNRTGPVVRAILDSRRLTPDALVVVYDDLDLPFGDIRLKPRGGSGGHNGMKSILESLGTIEICRLKLGIGRPQGSREVVDYVLSPFSPQECIELEAILERSADALECLIQEGIVSAMNRFHGGTG